jgi:hypothetical protein
MVLHAPRNTGKAERPNREPDPPGLTSSDRGVTCCSRLMTKASGSECQRVRSLRTQQRAESQCHMFDPHSSRGVGVGLIDIESANSWFSALDRNSSTESLILAQDERWRRA